MGIKNMAINVNGDDRDPWWMWAVIVGLAPLLMAIGLAVAAWEWIFNDNER